MQQQPRQAVRDVTLLTYCPARSPNMLFCCAAAHCAQLSEMQPYRLVHSLGLPLAVLMQRHAVPGCQNCGIRAAPWCFMPLPMGYCMCWVTWWRCWEGAGRFALQGRLPNCMKSFSGECGWSYVSLVMGCSDAVCPASLPHPDSCHSVSLLWRKLGCKLVGLVGLCLCCSPVVFV
eukprot:scaffold97288_cov19-Tisochrysis_lutea.AAC.2